MSKPPYRALQVALRIFSILLAIGALFVIFGSRGLVIVLMVSAMLFLAARDPERNVVVVDGLIVGLVILSVTPLLSLYTTDIQRIFPGHLIWGRSVVRLVFAAFFFFLRPRGTHWKPAGDF
jgi:hypothetical protein